MGREEEDQEDEGEGGRRALLKMLPRYDRVDQLVIPLLSFLSYPPRFV